MQQVYGVIFALSVGGASTKVSHPWSISGSTGVGRCLNARFAWLVSHGARMCDRSHGVSFLVTSTEE